MIFFSNYPCNACVDILFGIIVGYIYGLLFVQKQTGVFLLSYTKSKILIFDFLRIFILGCIIGYLLLNDLYGSILMMVCFLISFWIKLLY